MNSTLTHNIEVTFKDLNTARMYFNTGGKITFQWSHTPLLNNNFNKLWQNLLATNTGVAFDYTGMILNGQYQSQVGFYPLMESSILSHTIFSKIISDNSIEVGRLEIICTKVISTSVKLAFAVNFIVSTEHGDTVVGSTKSSVYLSKLKTGILDITAIPFATVTQSGTFLAV